MTKNFKDINILGKKVLLRIDFEAPFERCLPSLEYALSQKAQVIILGSLKNPKESLGLTSNKLSKALNKPVDFIFSSFLEEETKEQIKNSQDELILLENLSRYPEEINGDKGFARSLSELGDIFVNDAFEPSLQNYASITTLPSFLPSFAGFGLMEEIKTIGEKRKSPIVVIIGGNSIVPSISFVHQFLTKADCVLVGGKIAEVILRVKGMSIGKNWPDEETVQVVEQLELTNLKLHLPVDVVVAPRDFPNVYTRLAGPGGLRKEEDIFDIGPETVKLFSNIIKTAETIIWHGPLGMYELPKFNHGTKDVALAITRNENSFKLVGGKSTVDFLNEFNLAKKMSFLSKGGIAMMELFLKGSLPGIKALEEKSQEGDNS